MKSGKRISKIRRAGGEMPPAGEVISGPQNDSIELVRLIFSFQNALAASDRKMAKEILSKIDNAINDQFKFERNVLYPRIRGLGSKMIKELREEQRMIDEFIDEAVYLTRKGRAGKTRLFALSKIIPIVTDHLRDCSDLTILCNKFGENRLSRHKEWEHRYGYPKTGH